MILSTLERSQCSIYFICPRNDFEVNKYGGQVTSNLPGMHACMCWIGELRALPDDVGVCVREQELRRATD